MAKDAAARAANGHDPGERDKEWFMKRRDFLAGTTLGLTTAGSGRRVDAATEAAKYRVAVIGRTGKGDYGHGLDVVWNDVRSRRWWPWPTRTKRAGPRPPSGSKRPKTYADYREMLEKERPQIVSVAAALAGLPPRHGAGLRRVRLPRVPGKAHGPHLEEADEMVAAWRSGT